MRCDKTGHLRRLTLSGNACAAGSSGGLNTRLGSRVIGQLPAATCAVEGTWPSKAGSLIAVQSVASHSAEPMERQPIAPRRTAGQHANTHAGVALLEVFGQLNLEQAARAAMEALYYGAAPR